MKIKNKYLDFFKYLFDKIFKKEYNITMINEKDKEIIKKLYFEDLISIDEIAEKYKGIYKYSEIRSYLFNNIK